MTPEIKALYKPPFKYDGRAYIQDSEYNMVADFKDPDLMPGQGKEFRPRGWGRIGQMPDGARLHDEVSAFMEGVVGGEQDPEKCVQLLNEAWGHD